jgi:Replication protein
LEVGGITDSPPTCCDRKTSDPDVSRWQASIDALPSSIFDARHLPSQLDPPETESEANRNPVGGSDNEAARLALAFRHSGWVPNRRRVFESLQRTGQPRGRIESFALCGSHAYLLQSVDDPSKFRVAGSTCHDRFCVPCANERARTIRNNVIDQLDGKVARFMTLTTKANSCTLQERLNHLYDSFRRLRATKLWRDNVTGGVAFLEVKHSNRSEDWHPHLHCLIEGSWIDKRKLSQQWLSVTGNSKIVDIGLCRDTNHVGAYATKYASKPLNCTFASTPDLLDEAVHALKGRRLAYTFGDWRGLLLIQSPSESEWENLGSINVWITKAINGDVEAQNIMNQLYPNSQIRFPHVDTRPRPPPTSANVVQEQASFFHTFDQAGTHYVQDTNVTRHRH